MRVRNTMARISQHLHVNQKALNHDMKHVEILETKLYLLLWDYVFKRVYVHFLPCDSSLDDKETAHVGSPLLYEKDERSSALRKGLVAPVVN